MKDRLLKRAALTLVVDLLYAVYHGVLGFVDLSWWFLSLCAYYVILSMTRFAAVLCGEGVEMEQFVRRIIGLLLILLSGVLAGMNYLSIREQIAARRGEIIMITIAAYTFTKLTLAVIRAVRQRGDPSPLRGAIRAIGYAEVLASILTLQRSMLASFGSMAPETTRLMNSLTGAGVCFPICGLGSKMIIKEK